MVRVRVRVRVRVKASLIKASAHDVGETHAATIAMGELTQPE